MSDLVRKMTARRGGVSRWLLWAFPVAAGLGIALAWGSADPTQEFSPRRGPADPLPGTGVVLPKTPTLVQTSYLQRMLEQPSERDLLVRVFADRYNITRTLARSILNAAEREGLDPELAFRLIRVESVFDPAAVSRGGALGLTQVMPGTARDLDPSVRTRAQLLDPETNMRIGFGLLRDMIHRYEGDVRLGVLAYNRGEIAVDRAVRRGTDPENGYSIHVLGPRHHGGKPYQGKGVLEQPDSTAATADVAPNAQSRTAAP